MKTISVFLALLNSLIAGLIMAVSLSRPELIDAATSWLAIKTAAGLAVIGISAVTWLAAARAVNLHLVLLAGLSLAIIGTATIIWTLHLAIVTGDMEGYMVAFGCSLIVQGLTLLWNPLSHLQRTIIS